MTSDEDVYAKEFERRDTHSLGKRYADNHQPPCTQLKSLEIVMIDLKEHFRELKSSIKEISDEQHEFIEDQRQFRESLMDRMTTLEATVLSSKSFLSGAGWILGIVAAVAVWLIDRISPHFKL